MARGSPRKTSPASLSVWPRLLGLTGTLSPPEEKNKEKEKGGDNSTDATAGTSV